MTDEIGKALGGGSSLTEPVTAGPYILKGPFQRNR